MSKNKVFTAGILVMILVFGMAVSGCATTKHSMEISNIGTNNIRGLYIKNAGTANWGTNLMKNMNDIDITNFSTTVDIRVIDTNGIIYERYDVPFSNAAFTETGKTSTMNPWVGGILGIGLIVTAVIVL